MRASSSFFSLVTTWLLLRLVAGLEADIEYEKQLLEKQEKAPPSDKIFDWDHLLFANWHDTQHMEDQDMDPAVDQISQEGGIVTFESGVRELEDLVILGAGPAGLTAAIYAARANLRPLLISKDSGQLSKTGTVENYPSCDASPSGSDIIESSWKQARKFGARSLIAEVNRVDFAEQPYKLYLSTGDTLTFRDMIVATGAHSRRMNEIPGEEQYYGMGVASCATCEGWFFRGRRVVVVGGGDTAMEEALFLSRICKSVTVVHRGDRFRASKAMANLVLANPKIAVMWNTTVEAFDGDGHKLTHVALSNSWTESGTVLEVDGAFVAVGQNPNTEAFRGGLLDLDEPGYIKTHSGTLTNLDGVFAAGDVADRVYRQAITSAGTGAMAAMDAERHLCHLGC